MIEHKIIGQVMKSSDIALIAHISPDGDAIGSCLALSSALRKMGKKVDVICQDKHPSELEFLDNISDIIEPDKAKQKYSLCIAIDCSDIKRMGKSYNIFKASEVTVNIDHHTSNTFYADYNFVVPDASAAGELIYDLLIKADAKMDKGCAEALYTAISTDTGSFCFNNTNSKTYRIASELVAFGLDVDYITKQLYRNNKLQKVLLLREALNTLEFFYNFQVSVLTITCDMVKKIGAEDSDTENLVNYAIDIKGVKIGILIKEIGKNMVKLSFRSVENIDVSKIASVFGGGGHKRAAGAVVSLKAEEAKKAVLEVIQKTEELTK